MNARGIARLGTLAVGLGIGAAWANVPVASADSSDWLSSIDNLLGGAVPALVPTSGLDLAISFDGTSLYQSGTAVADSGAAGEYNWAIAYGGQSVAIANSGTGDTAIADGAGSGAAADGSGDYALADGTNALANAGGGAGENYDTAIDIGNNDVPMSGSHDGAYAGGADLIGNTNGGTGSYDTAIDIGNDTNSGTAGGHEGAFSGAGGLVGASGDGNHDTAINFGNDSGFDNGASAIDGNYDYASASGDLTGQSIGAQAGLGNGDIASVVGGTSSASAGGDFGTNVAGNYDIAQVFDPFGTVGSFAGAGATGADPGSYDFASAFADDLSAFAQGANYLFETLPSLF